MRIFKNWKNWKNLSKKISRFIIFVLFDTITFKKKNTMRISEKLRKRKKLVKFIEKEKYYKQFYNFSENFLDTITFKKKTRWEFLKNERIGKIYRKKFLVL